MRALLCSALLALTLSFPARAGNLLDLAVVDRDTGETLITYMLDGRLYVAGAPGHRYAVRLTNRTGARVLAVLSVDGVNAVSGETASTGQSGYVLDAWESTEINGWRKNLDEIAQFNFTSLPNSYAARTGRPDNVGVIGVAVFTERTWHRPQPPQIINPAPRPWAKQEQGAADSMAREAAPAASAESPALASAPPPAPAAGAMESESSRSKSMAQRLGTGHGDREWSQVETTQFRRASSRPAESLAIWYDSYPNLVARGIIVRTPIARYQPDPFPNGFVADPPPRYR